MKINTKSVVKYLLLLLLTAGMLFLAFRKVEWGDFWEIMAGCNWWWIVATMLLQCVITLLRGERWRVMLRPLSRDFTTRECYDAYAICYLANLIFPRSGEVVRCGLAAETKKANFEGALGTVVIERTWDILCVFLSCIPLLFFGNFRTFLYEKMFKPAAAALNLGNLWTILIIAAIVIALIFIVRAKRKKIAASRPGAAVIGFFRGLADGIKAAFRMERKWEFFAYTLIIWVFYWLCSLWTVYAFPQAASLDGWDALFLMVVGSLGWIVPVQGGFGVYHFIVATTLVPVYGFSQDAGLAFATISHESQVVQMLVIGLISLASWALWRRRNRKAAIQDNNVNSPIV